mmetsp:Transcript_89742/g.187487  ORF Transcript_89742/g.187487 Transcript_89742/m.187487 type:complete len:493 (-) Transcript_89742:53-1531(-)|eukprot:CAMPEP_0206455616 /NCGR_PEP_ID=MMETSP0324_2-20121206/21864_1 /ASSEMBLY_ACC=CAM_ASM_000836 /TAXON_ID=2866 /ORGANISM="Crypthecodinium cohnii, Strain Seligo" /LENGTH=492 /DNA_ID=CAMNT_0053926365 /DNA_START=355 /DNA_END=1833 /DNA_ORIENTATION=-
MMQRGFTLCLASLVLAAEGHRHTEVLEIHPVSWVNRSAIAMPFKVLSSTFNAGNRKCEKGSDFDVLFQSMFAGHETADLVIAGFQEYRDLCRDHETSVHSQIKDHILWPGKGPVLADKVVRDTHFCHAVEHYDTGLHVFVNPESPWQVQFGETDKERLSKKTVKGNGQCGKVINFLKMRFQHKQDSSLSFSVCGMNTHFSFKGKADDRINAAKMGSDLATEAGCDSIFFMGDFNSRLHCEPNEAEARSAEDFCRRTPVNGNCHQSSEAANTLKENSKTSQVGCHAKCTSESNCAGSQWCNGKCSSVDIGGKPSEKSGCSYTVATSKLYQMASTFCTFNEAWGMAKDCKLDGPTLYYDELAQIIENDKVYCYEEETEKAGGHTLVEYDNAAVSSFGWKEAGPVNFAPSYKVTLENAKKAPPQGFQVCTGTKYCLSSNNEPKHNFAWTDRVLMKGSPKATITQTEDYSRREPATHFNSDHLPVTAIVDLSVQGQ